MDAGKINSLAPGLRPNVGGSHAGPSQGDAAFAAKIAAVVVLDDLLQASEGDPHAGPAIAVVPLGPRPGVVVNLSTGVVAAELAARLGSASPRPGETMQPNPATSTTPAPGHVYSLTERLGDSSRALTVASNAGAGVSPEDRQAPGLAPSSGSAAPPAPGEVRNDFYPFMPSSAALSPRPEAVEQRNAVAAAIAQARDSERLAGMHVKSATEVEVPPPWLSLERIVLGALALGVLVVLFV